MMTKDKDDKKWTRKTGKKNKKGGKKKRTNHYQAVNFLPNRVSPCETSSSSSTVVLGDLNPHHEIPPEDPTTLKETDNSDEHPIPQRPCTYKSTSLQYSGSKKATTRTREKVEKARGRSPESKQCCSSRITSLEHGDHNQIEENGNSSTSTNYFKTNEVKQHLNLDFDFLNQYQPDAAQVVTFITSPAQAQAQKGTTASSNSTPIATPRHNSNKGIIIQRPTKLNHDSVSSIPSTRFKKSVQVVDIQVAPHASIDTIEVGNPRKCACCRKCMKKTCPWWTREIPIPLSDYNVRLPEKRTENSLEYLMETYKRLIDTHIQLQEAGKLDRSQEKYAKFHLKLTETFKHGKNAVNFMHRVHLYCGDAIKSLSYYFEADLTEEQFRVVDGRSLIGSYMWVIIMCMKSVRGGVDYEADDFDETKRTLEDIVGLSFVIWRGVKHIVGAFAECRAKTEKTIITPLIEPFDPDLNIKPYLKSDIGTSLAKMDSKSRKLTLDQQKRNSKGARKILKNERKQRLKQIALHNKVGGNEDIPIDNPWEFDEDIDDVIPIPPPPAVRVTKKLLVGVEKASKARGWSPYDGFKASDRLSTLNSLCKRVVQIYEEVHGYLRSLDKYLHQVMLDDTIKYETSYYEAIVFMHRRLKYVFARKKYLRTEDRAALVEMGKILDDELDLTEFFVMTLRKIAHESRHAVHVCYEFARLFQKCSLPNYEIIAPPEPNYCRCLERLRLKNSYEDYEFRKIGFRNAVTQFNTSPYIEVLKLFPVRGTNYQLRVEDLAPMDESKYDSR